MFPGVNPRQMQQMMRKMGIQQGEIPAKEDIIRTEDKEIVISNPSVSKVNMMGQETYQVVGKAEERPISTGDSINEDDIKTVVEQAHVSEEEARKALEENNGDIAAAIMSLKSFES